MINEDGWLLKKIADYENKTAIIYQNNKYSFSALSGEVLNMAGLLEENKVQKGDVVAMLSEYSFDSIALFLALMDNKNIIVPITSKTFAEIEEILKESYSDTIINLRNNDIEFKKLNSGKNVHELISNLREENKSGLILFSSGSTGKPKAMIHNLDNLVGVFKERKEKKLIILMFLMFDHIGGLNTLFNALSMGSTIVIAENRDADHICSLIEKHKINVLPTTPTFLNLIMISESYKRYDLSSLKMITYGTEPMPTSLLKRLKNAFPRARFMQTFGTSETGITRTSSKSSSSTLMRIEDPNIEYKIVEGELWLKSGTQVMGYLNYEMDNFTEDGWFKTGDLVEEVEGGYLKITGRDNEIINVGGEKVIPNEVESVLLELPQIADCMVYGEPNAITGQMVVADVVIKGLGEFSGIKKAIRKFCREKLVAYKIPVRINILDQITFGKRFKKIRRKL